MFNRSIVAAIDGKQTMTNKHENKSSSGLRPGFPKIDHEISVDNLVFEADKLV
jgi:hypothetical protein